MITKKISYRQALKKITELEELVKELKFVCDNQALRIDELKEDIDKLVENNDTWSEVLPNPDDKEAWGKYWQERMTVTLVKPSELESIKEE